MRRKTTRRLLLVGCLRCGRTIKGPGTSEIGSSVLRIFDAELVETEGVTAADETEACEERFPVTRLRTSNETQAWRLPWRLPWRISWRLPWRPLEDPFGLQASGNLRLLSGA